MALVLTRSVILHSFAYGETSRILRILTPEYGVRSVIAKGAMSPRSRFGGLLEPFTEGEAQFHLRPGRDLLTLSGFSLLRSRQAIGRDLAAFTGASLLAELLLRFGTEEAQPEVYEALVRALDQLASDPADPGAIALANLWHLVTLFGFQPELRHCVGCGRMLDDPESSRFDAVAGGAACLACRPTGRIVPAAVRLEVTSMCLLGPLPKLVERRTHADLLHHFLGTHFHDTPLRSLPIFLDQIR